MKLAFAVQHANPFDELPEDVPDPLPAKRRGRRRSTNVLDEVDALHELHREEAIGAFHDELVQRHEIRMGDVGQAAKLTLELIDVGRSRPKQRFQRDDLQADPVVHFVHDAHPARTQLPAHRETLGPPELRARSKRGQRGLNRKGIVSRCKDAERIRGDRRLEEPARALVCAHEAVELVPQAIIARAGLVEEGPALVGRACDGRLE